MINSSRALVFAMLSTASGWALPSHDSLLSSNESTSITGGVDGPRDRRQLGYGSSCDGGWSVLPAPRAAPDLPSLRLPLPSCLHSDGWIPPTSCDENCDHCDGWGGLFSCDSSCDSMCNSGETYYDCNCHCDTCVGVSCPQGYTGAAEHVTRGPHAVAGPLPPP